MPNMEGAYQGSNHGEGKEVGHQTWEPWGRHQHYILYPRQESSHWAWEPWGRCRRHLLHPRQESGHWAWEPLGRWQCHLQHSRQESGCCWHGNHGTDANATFHIPDRSLTTRHGSHVAVADILILDSGQAVAHGSRVTMAKPYYHKQWNSLASA